MELPSKVMFIDFLAHFLAIQSARAPKPLKKAVRRRHVSCLLPPQVPNREIGTSSNERLHHLRPSWSVPRPHPRTCGACICTQNLFDTYFG